MGVELEDKLLRGYFTNQFFRYEHDYNLDTNFTDKIFFSWLAYGQDPSLPWNIAIEVVPPMWESEASRALGHEPIRETEFRAGAHYLDENLDARLMWPFVHSIEGHFPKWYFELRRLEIARINNSINLIARGRADPDRIDFAFGGEFKLPLNFTGRVYYGTNDNDFEWSVSYKTYFNR
jgi:hypothetical protein